MGSSPWASCLSTRRPRPSISRKGTYLDDAFPAIAAWAVRYQAQFKEAPTVFSVYGYTMIELPADMFGNPPMHFSATRHLGSDRSRLSQLQNGRWKVVLDYDQMK